MKSRVRAVRAGFFFIAFTTVPALFLQTACAAEESGGADETLETTVVTGDYAPTFGELVEVKNAVPERLGNILESGTIVGLRWWPSYYTYADVEYLVVAFSNPGPVWEESTVRFYEIKAREPLAVENLPEADLYLRYLYTCDRPVLGLDTFSGADASEFFLLVRYPTPSSTTVLVVFGQEKDKLRCVWESLERYNWEVADLDNDLSQEVITTGGELLKESYPGKLSPEFGFIYKFIDGRFRLVAKVPYEDRLSVRELPDVPLEEEEADGE